jgi:hypothetical protein
VAVLKDGTATIPSAAVDFIAFSLLNFTDLFAYGLTGKHPQIPRVVYRMEAGN